MSPKRTRISSREVSTKVLGSANPLAKGFRDGYKGCMDSVTGIFVGLLLFLLAFIPTCYSTQVAKVSAVVEELPVMSPGDAEGASGLIALQGTVDAAEYEEIYIDCSGVDDYVDLFWYDYEYYEYTEHMETRQRTETEVRDGKEVEVTYEDEELVEDWELLDSEGYMSPSFDMGNIEIRPSGGDIRLTDYRTCEDKGREQVGSEWILYKYIPLDSVSDMLVVGNISSDKISSGDPFIITDMNMDELVQALVTGEKTTSMVLTIVAILMFFIAFNMIIGPLLFMLKYVPIIGAGLRFLIGIVSLILAIVLVLLLRLVFAFWWLILIIIIGIVVFLIVRARNKADEPEVGQAESKPAYEPPSEDAASPSGAEEDKPNFCPECGDPVDPGEKFCNNCGHKLSD